MGAIELAEHVRCSPIGMCIGVVILRVANIFSSVLNVVWSSFLGTFNKKVRCQRGIWKLLRGLMVYCGFDDTIGELRVTSTLNTMKLEIKVCN